MHHACAQYRDIPARVQELLNAPLMYEMLEAVQHGLCSLALLSRCRLQPALAVVCGGVAEGGRLAVAGQQAVGELI